MSLPLLSLITEEADRCVACGLCLPHCPTYRKTGSEADSPRGRIQLMRAVAMDILPNNRRFHEHIDLCLSCRSCETTCPNNVNYGALLDSTRAQLTPKTSVVWSMAKPFIRHRFLARILIWKLYLLQKILLDGWLKTISPVAKFLPKLVQPVEWKSLYPATNNRQGRVNLFLGCVTSAVDSKTLKASIYVLNKLGFDVHIPKQQTCCGGMARQMGDADEAIKLVAINKINFDQAMPLITVASGCGAGLNDYLTEHTVIDISAFLLTCDWSNVLIKPIQATIYVQDPCSLRNVQKSASAVYSLLKKIPQADIQALPGNSQCCGGAGAYILSQSAMANNLRQDKLSAIAANKVTILATSNIGCNLHISQGLREQSSSVSVLHPIEIIAQQMYFTGTV